MLPQTPAGAADTSQAEPLCLPGPGCPGSLQVLACLSFSELQLGASDGFWVQGLLTSFSGVQALSSVTTLRVLDSCLHAQHLAARTWLSSRAWRESRLCTTVDLSHPSTLSQVSPQQQGMAGWPHLDRVQGLLRSAILAFTSQGKLFQAPA